MSAAHGGPAAGRHLSPGVSVAICCHNGAARLRPTLARLAEQRVPDGLAWEVILIDNASTDGTAEVAADAWPATAPVPLRVVREPRLGLTYARHRALTSARFETLSLVDDDNWVHADWVSSAAALMDRLPHVAACGGMVDPVYEVAPPPWFERHKGWFALGAQGPRGGDVTWTRGMLFGAGLIVRTSAWHQLIEAGFKPLLIDRTGAQLTTGGDVELCYALRLAGWCLWYEPSLHLQHFMPAGRMRWQYLRALFRSNGAASIRYIPYLSSARPRAGLRLGPRETWPWLVFLSFATLVRRPRRTLRAVRQLCEGDDYSLELERQFGRVTELLRLRNDLHKMILDVRHAAWRAPRQPSCSQ